MSGLSVAAGERLFTAMRRKGGSLASGSLGEARVLLFIGLRTLPHDVEAEAAFPPLSSTQQQSSARSGASVSVKIHAYTLINMGGRARGPLQCLDRSQKGDAIIQYNHTNTHSNAMVHIERAWLFAAARIHLHEPFSLQHFDALCATLKHVHPTPALSSHAGGGGDDGATAYEALCEWLLEVRSRPPSCRFSHIFSRLPIQKNQNGVHIQALYTQMGSNIEQRFAAPETGQGL